MKKTITLLMAVAMVIGFAGIAAADCFSCQGTPGNIDRGCETGQDWCYPFDFETPEDYCDDYKKIENRAIFKICDCITDGDFDTVVAGDTIDISMEILVNGETGDNGVYWAEDVSTTGIPLGLYTTQDLACAQEDAVYPERFEGVYRYLLANGNVGAVDDSQPGIADTACLMADSNRVTKIELDRVASGPNHGYVVLPGDEIAGNASWAIDIPELRVDPSRVSAGDQVWVRICLLLDCTGICSEDVTCCCDIYIGELCCPFDSSDNTASMIYPYFPPADSAAFNLLGMTITNMSAVSGDATIIMYESDGDVGSVTVSVDPKGIYLTTIADLASAMTQTDGAGTLGDAKSYITVTCEFPATGFAMIADTVDGASMGYLPIDRNRLQ